MKAGLNFLRNLRKKKIINESGWSWNIFLPLKTLFNYSYYIFRLCLKRKEKEHIGVIKI